MSVEPIRLVSGRDPHRTAPRNVTRAGTNAIEAIFRFYTAEGRGSGVLRLTPDANDADKLKAWTLLTALDEIKGFEEQVGRSRPKGTSYSRDFRGPNWLDLRKSAAEYLESDPVVLVVGGGQAGLSIAARLRQLQVDTLIVDRWPRIGDNWRTRYHALTLHNQVQVNHLPYMPFPPSWPTYIPKDKLAGWFEAYVEGMELNYWTATEFEGGAYNEKAERWSVVLRRADGTKREMRPRHVVMATGVSGIPNLPDIPTLGNFAGKLLHSSQYEDGEAWKGKNALVIGTGNSGHDIAQDLHSSGAKVTLVQRNSTLIVNIEPSAQLPHALYDEGPRSGGLRPHHGVHPRCRWRGRATSSMTAASAGHGQGAPRRARPRRLQARFRRGRTPAGSSGTSPAAASDYFDVGCSDLIVDARDRTGAILRHRRPSWPRARACAAATRYARRPRSCWLTGYKGQDYLVRKLFGDDVATRVGPIWGFGDEQELRNMFTRTAQPGLWFIAGSLAQCRIYSKYLGLADKGLRDRPATCSWRTFVRSVEGDKRVRHQRRLFWISCEERFTAEAQRSQSSKNI